MNGNLSWKVLAVIVAMIASFVTGGWAIDARMDRKIHEALGPIRTDVRDIRLAIRELVRIELEGRR